MTQYIDKSALTAWIKEKKIPFKKDIDDGVYPTYLCALMDFEDFLDTLDVKEVDLEQEIKDILNQYYYFPEEAIDIPTIIRITAHHFFEIGLKTQKGE